jgi:hypothetical protein
LPALFDNYKKEKIGIPVLKKNPEFEFGIKYPPKVLITKEHCIDMLGVNTPGVGNYRPVISKTFDEIKIKNDLVQ